MAADQSTPPASNSFSVRPSRSGSSGSRPPALCHLPSLPRLPSSGLREERTLFFVLLFALCLQRAS